MYYNQSWAEKGNNYRNTQRARTMQRAAVNIFRTDNSYELLVFAPGRIKERLEAWKASPVTTLTMYPSSPEHMRLAAELILES